ncbi:MAG: hypothetical protein JOZ83_06610 [Silvibacterium sp.]|nr:hypothetical protein [Silvibacterium sp.]
MKAFLLLGGVVSLCGMSFEVGRVSAEVKRPALHAIEQMNELDRLEMETKAQK